MRLSIIKKNMESNGRKHISYENNLKSFPTEVLYGLLNPTEPGDNMPKTLVAAIKARLAELELNLQKTDI